MASLPGPWLEKYPQHRLLLTRREVETWEAKGPGRHHLLKLNRSGQPRFKAEFEFLSSLTHSGFPRPICCEAIDGVECYAREFIGGTVLADYFGALPPPELGRLLGQVLRALSALHFRGWAHGDLSASNIIMEPGGRAVLIDFEFLAQRHRPVDTIHGTPTTMAPELFWGKPPTIPTDLYAIGCLLYALIAGRYPFEAESFDALLQKHALEEPSDPTAGRAEFAPALGLIALRLLAKEPGSRFAEANDVIVELNRALRLNEPPEAPPPHSNLQERLRVAKAYSQDQEAIRFLSSKPKPTAQELKTLAELLLKTRRLEALEEILPRLPGELPWLYRGLLLNRRGRYDSAVQHLAAGKAGADFRAAVGLSIAYYYTGRIDEALKTLDEASASEPRERCALINSKGNLFFYSRRLKEAESCFAEALEYARAAGSVGLEALVLMNLGNVQVGLKSWGDALENYYKASELYQGLGLNLERVKCDLNLSGLLRFFGHLDKAEELISQAKRQFLDTPHPQLEAYADLLAADLKKKKGDYAAAEASLQKARTSLQGNPSASDQGDLWISLAEIQLATGAEELEQTLGSAQALAGDHSDALLGERVEFLRLLHEGLKEKSFDPEKIYFSAEKLCEQGDLEFVLDDLQRARIRAQEAQLAWPPPLEVWARGLAETTAAQVPADYQSFFRHFYRKIWENQAMKIPPAFPASSSQTDTQLQSVLEWVRELTGTLSLEALTEKILDRMLKFTRMERGFVLLKEGERLYILQSREINPGDFKQDGPEGLSWSLTREAMEQGVPLMTSDAQGDERLSTARSVHALQLKAILVLPFRFRGEIHGAVYLDSRLQAEHLEPQDLPYLSGLAEILGLAVRNAKVFEQHEEELNQTRQALERSQQDLEVKYRYENIQGRAESTRAFLQRVDRVTDVRVPVLIRGESGVGKELVARAIHYNGPLKKAPFVAANCSAIPESLVESELFGHERGAFTGAVQSHVGLFEQANRGTLFLDEIGDMPLPMQAKLLRVLQDGELHRVGGQSLIKVQIRLIAATHRDLKQEIAKGRFREDLFYRLCVAEIHIPPLRERREDIPVLAEHFLKKFAEQNQVSRKKLDVQALAALTAYAWPGNIRELENLVYNLCVFSSGETIGLEDLKQKPEIFALREGISLTPKSGKGGKSGLSVEIDNGKLNLSEAKRRFEREQIVRVLSLHQGKVGEAAKHLGLPRPQLSRLLAYHQIR